MATDIDGLVMGAMKKLGATAKSRDEASSRQMKATPRDIPSTTPNILSTGRANFSQTSLNHSHMNAAIPADNNQSTTPTFYNTPGSTPPVVETPYIHLEFDPVKKRKMLNSYEIVSDLGAGQHGKVKLAIDSATGEQVAIKILDRAGRRGRLPEDASSLVAENEAKIRKEIAIMKKCRHKNIVRLKEVIDDHRLRKIYLVLEYLENGELRWSKDDHAVLLFSKTRKLFKDVVLGLEYLHYHGVIHRDIKPANLLLSKEGVVKISDFGVSFLVAQEEQSEYDLCKTAGTPAFYAPELCSIDFDRLITHKVDLWALGVTLYCLAFGVLPFRGKTEFEVFEKISKEEPRYPTLEEFRSSGPSENLTVTEEDYSCLISLLKELLQKNPLTRIDIPEVKLHPFVRSAPMSSQERFLFEHNLLLNLSDATRIDVSLEEMGTAITDIGTRIRSGFQKVWSLTGLSDKRSPKLHRLSISSAFSRSGSNSSSRKDSKGITFYTPLHVQLLQYKDSLLSLRSKASEMLDNSLERQSQVYTHGNLTGSFVSPSLSTHGADYFDKKGSQISLNLDRSMTAHTHKRNISGGLAALSEASIEGGFFVHARPIASTLNHIMEQSGAPGSPTMSLPIFGLGNRLRNSSFFGYNNGVTLPRKSSNVSLPTGTSLPVNLSYASLNSMDDDLLYSTSNGAERVIGYCTPNSVAPNVSQNVSGLLNNAHSASGFLNGNASGFLSAIGTNLDKFKFDESAKQKIYGKKNKDFFQGFGKAVGTTTNDKAYSKAPSISTINETDSAKNEAIGGKLKLVSDSEDDSEDEVIQFSVGGYKDRSQGFLDGFSEHSTDNENDLRPVDSIVTVPNSLILKLNSAETSGQASLIQLTKLFPNAKPRWKDDDDKVAKFQFGYELESDGEDSQKTRYADPLLLRRKLLGFRPPVADESGSSDSDDDSEQELTFNFLRRGQRQT